MKRYICAEDKNKHGKLKTSGRHGARLLNVWRMEQNSAAHMWLQRRGRRIVKLLLAKKDKTVVFFVFMVQFLYRCVTFAWGQAHFLLLFPVFMRSGCSNVSSIQTSSNLTLYKAVSDLNLQLSRLLSVRVEQCSQQMARNGLCQTAAKQPSFSVFHKLSASSPRPHTETIMSTVTTFFS